MASNKKAPRESVQQQVVIGLTGPVGSGCTTMARLLADKYGYKLYKISDLIEADMKAASVTIGTGSARRSSLQDHGNLKRKERLDYWVQALWENIKEDKATDQKIVIDGIRNLGEVEALRMRFPNFFLIAVCCERDQRWKRIFERYDGDNASFNKDDRRDQNEGIPHGQNVQDCVDNADYVFANKAPHFIKVKGVDKPESKKYEHDFEKQIGDFLPLMEQRMGDQRPANTTEVHMAAAYALSNASRCVKRRVGAVITTVRNGQELPVSTGYNENPAGTEMCVTEGGCFKDEKIDSWFSAQSSLFCPNCGQKIDKPTTKTTCVCGDSIRDWLKPNRGMELCTAIHAEERAIKSLAGRTAEGGTVYTTTFPCFQCARQILDSGIKRVVYVEAYPVSETSEFLNSHGCATDPFTGFTCRAFFRVFKRTS